MRALILALSLSACVGAPPEPEPEPARAATYILATCDDFAEIFCVRAAECFPALPVDWCMVQEMDLCTAGAWTISETCLDAISELECSGSSLTVPCACNPNQDYCEAAP